MLLERKTVAKAEEAMKRLGWDSDDAYYGAEQCARLRAWAEADWAQANEEEAEAEEARRAAAHEDTSSDDSSSAPDTPRSATTAATRRRRAKQSPTDAGLRGGRFQLGNVTVAGRNQHHVQPALRNGLTDRGRHRRVGRVELDEAHVRVERRCHGSNRAVMVGRIEGCGPEAHLGDHQLRASQPAVVQFRPLPSSLR